MSRLRAFAHVSLSCLAGITVARAQSATELPTVDVSSVGNNAAPVAGSLTTPPIKEKYQLPQTSESITAEKIQQQVNLVDTEDALKYFPSLFVRKRNNGDTQAVLATRTQGVGASARSLVYADDILLSALIANNNTIGAPRWGLVAPEEIARIDFLYGPFAAAYPGNAIGGIVQITTRMPEKFEFTAKQIEAFQTFDYYKTKGTYRSDQSSLSMGDKSGDVSWFLSGNFQNSFSQPLGFVTNATAPAGTSGTIAQTNRVGAPANVVGALGLLHTDMANVKGKVAWDITPWLKATFITGLWMNDTKSDVATYLTNAAGAPTYGGVQSFASNFYYLTEKHLSNAVSLKTDTKGVFDWDLSVSRYDYLESTQRNPFGVVPGAAATGFTTFGRQARLDGTNWTNGDAKGIWRAGGGHEVSFGFHGDRYVLDNPVYATPVWNADATNALYTNSQGATQTLALWAQDAWRFAPDWKLTLGGRWENWSAFNGLNFQTVPNTTTGVVMSSSTTYQPKLEHERFSPKATLAWEFAPTWEAKASFGQAYRFPTVAELYQIVTVGPVLATPNPNLQPENGLSSEFAIEKKFSDGKIRLSIFDEHLYGALVSQTGIVNGLPATFTVNVDAIRNTGVELAVSKDNVIITGLETFGSVTYVDSRILSNPGFEAATNSQSVGKRAPNVPDWRVTAGATYRPNEFWAFTAAVRYSGKQYATLDNSDTIGGVYQAFDSFTVADIRVQYKVSDQVTLNFGIDNVGDARYFLFHPFPGRTFIIDAKAKF